MNKTNIIDKQVSKIVLFGETSEVKILVNLSLLKNDKKIKK